jgi:hypothetical protein
VLGGERMNICANREEHGGGSDDRSQQRRRFTPVRG